MRAALLVLAVFAMLAAACSGADDTTTTTTEGDAAATDGATAEGDAPEGDSADDEVSGIDAAACSEAAETLQAVPAAMGEAMAGTGDFAALSAQAEAFSQLADQVPAEYADSFEVVGGAFAEIADTLGGLDLQAGEVPDAETQAALQELSTTLSSADFSTASAEVSQYFAAGCPQS